MAEKRRRRTADLAEQVSAAKDAEPAARRAVSERRIPTGSTLLNLALSDDPYGGFEAGRMVNIIGDRSAGKSLLLNSIYAEVLHNKTTADYRCIDDDAEASRSFNVAALWGEITANGVEAPFENPDGTPGRSNTMEDWRKNVFAALADERPFVYGLDSLDVLTSEAEIKRQDDPKKVDGGSYMLERQKVLPEIMRRIVRATEDTDSLLVVVSHARQDIGITFGDKNRRSFEKTLGFYESFELWLAVEETLKRTVNSKARPIGVKTRVRIKKNRLTGKVREVSFPIYYSYGLDDTESMIDFLLTEGRWSKAKGGSTITATDFDMQATLPKLVRSIEDQGLVGDLRRITAETWNDIEERLIDRDRKRRY